MHKRTFHFKGNKKCPVDAWTDEDGEETAAEIHFSRNDNNDTEANRLIIYKEQSQLKDLHGKV